MRRWPVLWAWLFGMAGAVWLGAVEVSLVNESMELAFDVAAGGALSGLRNLPCDTAFLPAASGEAAVSADRSPWLLVLRGADGALVEVTGRQAGTVRHRMSGRSLELIWEGVRPEGLEGDLQVTMRVTLVPAEAKSRWELSVEGSAEGLLWDVQFPRLLGLQCPAVASLAVPQYLGRVIRDPVASGTQVALEYPQPASMQWMAFWGTPTARRPVLQDGPGGAAVESGWRPDEADAAGLYLATEDSDGWHKRFVVDCRREPGRMAWWVHHLPPLDHWPSQAGRHPVSYTLPYPVVLTCFRGDAHEAAAIYREWARRKPWCRRGPADAWPAQSPAPGSPDEALWVPTWFRQVGFWAKFYHEPAKVVPEWAAYRRWLRVPMASHYYRYTIARFDDDYPEPLPADPYLLPGMVAAREMGVRPLPYINGVIWDTASQSWLCEGAQAAAIKDEAGAWIPWDIQGEIFAYMCPVESWRAKLREVTGKLVGEHAMAGVYLDCLAATRAMPCYDPLHQHSLRGGDYRSKGNRRLLEELRLGTRRLVPDAAFFTEEIGEQYLDLMDGFLTLDLTRSSLRPGEQVWPLFNAVYHPYGLSFGSDARLDMPPDAFAWQMGTLFTWGMVPLLSTGVAVPPTPGERNSEFLRELVQAYYCVGQPFLQEGQWERLTIMPGAGTRPGGPLSLSASPHAVLYEGSNQKPRSWQGPAILGSAWRQGGSLGVVLVNLTGEEQRGLLVVDAAALGLPASAAPTVLWPEGGSLSQDGAGSWPVVLGPGRVTILAFADPLRTWRRQALEECPWELLTADGGVLPERLEKDGLLWACSDGPVSQQFRAAEASVTAMAVGEQGALVRRVGRQADLRGAAAEGRGLPRRRLEQPFALLRRLPHRVTQGLPRVTVLGGDNDWLLCRVAGACELTFAKPGLAVVHGEDLADAASPLVLRDRVVVPGTPAGCLVAYWIPDRAVGRALADRARSAGAAVVEADASRQALERFHESPTLSRLADLSRSLATALEAARRSPALAAPGSPLVALAQRCNAMVAAASGMDLALVAEDDWLTPRLPKTVTLITTGASVPPDVRLVALAEAPQPGDVQVIPAPADVGSSLVRAQVVLLSDRHVERLVPVAAFARGVVAGESLVQSALLWFESNRPLRLQGPGAVPVALAGRETQAEVHVRNISPLDLKASFAVSGPEGWTVAVEPPTLALAGLAEGTLRLRLTPPPSATTQSAPLVLKATWVSGESEGILLPVSCSVRERLDVLRQPAAAATAIEPTPSRLRQKNQVAFWGQAGDQVAVRFRNRRVTAYQDRVKVRLLDPGFRELEVRTVAVDEAADVTLNIAETGVFHALLDAGSGSAEVDAGERPYAEVATAASPLRLFCSPVQRWFYVTKGASEFRIAARDGGPSETARLRIVDPQGRVAFERDGAWNGEPHAVTVPAGTAGQVWRLECWPVQDLSLWLEGGACPYLSTDPGEVPAPLAELAHP